jgi:hypothetical protein
VAIAHNFLAITLILIRIYLNVQPGKVNIFTCLELEQNLQNEVSTIMAVKYIINLNSANDFLIYCSIEFLAINF